MNILAWLFFGALAGWIANIIVGIIGAFLGGWLGAQGVTPKCCAK